MSRVLPWLIDVLLAPLSLYLATLIRQHLALGRSITVANIPAISDYAVVSLVWAGVLAIPYFVTHNLEARRGLVFHLNTVLKFDFIAIIGFAAWLFFFHTELSRLLFLYFCLGNMFLLINFHALVWSRVRWRS